MKAHVQERIDSVAKGTSLNWATAEALAMGTLLCQGRHFHNCSNLHVLQDSTYV